MRKHVFGDKSIEDANDRKQAREIAARGISLKPEVVVGKVDIKPFLDYINDRKPKVIEKKVSKKELKNLIKEIESVVSKPKKNKRRK